MRFRLQANRIRSYNRGSINSVRLSTWFRICCAQYPKDDKILSTMFTTLCQRGRKDRSYLCTRMYVMRNSARFTFVEYSPDSIVTLTTTLDTNFPWKILTPCHSHVAQQSQHIPLDQPHWCSRTTSTSLVQVQSNDEHMCGSCSPLSSVRRRKWAESMSAVKFAVCDIDLPPRRLGGIPIHVLVG